jgi:FAD/FMN-containing dehydrogenase
MRESEMADVVTRFKLPGFSGELLHPENPDYDAARRVFNRMIDRRPALIARCTNAADVAAAVLLARKEHLPLSVYGGGHSVTGAAVCDEGICVDLRGMKCMTVDPQARRARTEPGLTWGEFDAATQEHGLAVTGGRVSSTGVAGLALGSGSGWLERKLGFTCDSLVKAEVVTAAGDHVIASEHENADLFWGLRGGGGNFGIVTAFHFRLHPIGPILLGGLLIYSASAARDLLRFWRDFMCHAPDEVNATPAFITAPPGQLVSHAGRGQPAIKAVVSYNGPMEDGEEVLRPIREFGPPAVDLIRPMPYVALQRLLDPANPKGLENYWTADFFAGLPDDAIDVFVSHATRPVSPWTQIALVPGGGAMARIDEDATALGQRDAPFNVHYLSMWAETADAEKNITYTREFATAMKPWTTGRTYLNFIGDEGPGRVEAAFGPQKFARLRRLKAKWDPENLFRHNQNIPPADP